MFEKITFQQAVKQSQETNFYKRLGVDSRATQEQITSAHKKLAVVLHPDRNPDQQEAAQTAMKKVNAAAEILKDPDKRAAYDQKQSSSQQSTTQHSSRQQSSNRGQDWSQGAQVDPSWRSGSSSGFDHFEEILRKTKEQFKKEMEPLHMRALQLYGIESTRESALKWLSDPAREKNDASSINLILSAALDLRLITPTDVLNNKQVLDNLKAALTRFDEYSTLGRIPLEKTLKDNGIWDDRIFNTPEVATKRKHESLQTLANLIEEGCERHYFSGVRSFAWKFESLKESMVSSGILSADDISKSQSINEALKKLALSYEVKISKETSDYMVLGTTKGLASFLEKHSLRLPDEVRQPLAKMYATKISGWITALTKKPWNMSANLECIKEITSDAEKMGLAVTDELLKIPGFMEMAKAYAGNRGD